MGFDASNPQEAAINFYKHHIGDYDADTAHLSWLEDAAYRRLICLYYRREQPIPVDVAQACRLVRATSKPERDAVQTVLREFFSASDDGWRHRRCEEEIEVAGKKSLANRENGGNGGRPRKTVNPASSETEPNANPTQTQQKPTGFLLRKMLGSYVRAGPTARSQKPEARSQKPEKEKKQKQEQNQGPRPTASSAEPTTEPCPCKKIVALYHEKLPSLPRAKLLRAPRERALHRLWDWVLSSTKTDGARRATTSDEALDWFAGYFARASENNWLMGRIPSRGEHASWRCDLDFLLTDRGMHHVIEKTEVAA